MSLTTLRNQKPAIEKEERNSHTAKAQPGLRDDIERRALCISTFCHAE